VISGGDKWSNSMGSQIQSNDHHHQLITKVFTGWMPFLLPNQEYSRVLEKNSAKVKRPCVFGN